MDKEQMSTLIERYVHTHVIANQRIVVMNLLIGKQTTEVKNHPGKDDHKSFLALWEEYGGDVAIAIRETVKASTSSKSDAIARCRGFVGWLEGQTGETYDIDWPPVDVGNRFERIIYMMKVLQTEHTNLVEFLSDRLWISTRTIEDDLSVLMNEDRTADGTLLNESLYVNGLSRGRGTIEFLSTVHPILLLENLTCLTLTMHALLEKAQEPGQHDWLITTAGHIWSQLTDYAKVRITEVTVQKYGKKGAVTRMLAELERGETPQGFTPERYISSDAANQLMFAMKEGAPCKVDYLNEEGHLIHLEGLPRFDQEHHERVLMETQSGEQIPISFTRVVSCEIEAQLR